MSPLKEKNVALPRANISKQFFTCEELGSRWQCHSKTALRRMQRLGVKPIKLTKRSILFRMTDVLRVEAQCQ